MATPNNNIINSIINARYKVIEQLGEGGQGTVFKITDLQDNKE
jgi:serine/threonine protein kinase